MVVGGGESVVAQYKRQAEQIESLRAEFEDSEGEKRKRLEEISNIEESWLPSLRKVRNSDWNSGKFDGYLCEILACLTEIFDSTSPTSTPRSPAA